MSYDVYVGCSRCGSDLIRPCGRNNMTSNLSKMWSEASAPLADFQGKQAIDVLPLLQQAIDNLKDDPDYYRQLEPDNGWGDYGGCIEYLERILAACARDPFAKLRVSH